MKSNNLPVSALARWRVMALARYCVLALLSCGVAGLTGCAKKEIKNIGSKGESIICFGDSITFGYGADPLDSYPEYLAKLINRPVVNAGVDGDTSVDALRRLENDVLAKGPYLVVVEFSGNDFLKKVPIEKTFTNIREIVKRIQEKGAIAAIADISAGPFMREYRGTLKKIAGEEQAIFIPQVLKGIITNPSMKSDFFHPNALGYKLIAERVAAAVAPYINRRQ